MVVISSTTNEWPQSHHIDEKSSLMASTTSRLPMEEVPPSTHEPSQQQQIQQGLKCPRCDSSNTKFCYYNNYSLSQPRHFCKACKRYWTRGGTLRNVPVGGGCRKNKRVKRQVSSLEGSNTSSSTSNNITTTTTSASGANPNYNKPSSQPLMDMISSTPNHINPLFFGLPSNPSELNLPFPGRLNPSSRVSSSSTDGYDLQPQLNALGLGFSSGLIMSGATTTTDYPNGFIGPNKQIQDIAVNTANPLLASYSSIFGSSSPTISTSSPTMATLLASSFHHQKFGVKDTSKAPFDQFQTLTTTTPLEGLQVNGNSESGNFLKGVKIEPGQSMLDWSLSYQNQDDQIGFSDPNSLYWNTNLSSVGAWHDPANIGSSVTSLI